MATRVLVYDDIRRPGLREFTSIYFSVHIYVRNTRTQHIYTYIYYTTFAYSYINNWHKEKFEFRSIREIYFLSPRVSIRASAFAQRIVMLMVKNA